MTWKGAEHLWIKKGRAVVYADCSVRVAPPATTTTLLWTRDVSRYGQYRAAVCRWSFIKAPELCSSVILGYPRYLGIQHTFHRKNSLPISYLSASQFPLKVKWIFSSYDTHLCLKSSHLTCLLFWVNLVLACLDAWKGVKMTTFYRYYLAPLYICTTENWFRLQVHVFSPEAKNVKMKLWRKLTKTLLSYRSWKIIVAGIFIYF